MNDPSCAPRIETPRLVLAEHRRQDFEPLAAMWADIDVVRHIGGKPSSAQRSWSRLLQYRGLWPILGYGYWAIREKETERYVGDVGFADFHREAKPSISGQPEAGWVLAKWAHGRGYGSEAVAAALAWLDRSLWSDRVVGLVDSRNVASVRIAEKNGLLPAGMVELSREHVPIWARTQGVAP